MCVSSDEIRILSEEFRFFTLFFKETFSVIKLERYFVVIAKLSNFVLEIKISEK